MVFKEWGQLQRNSVKMFFLKKLLLCFINYIVLMGVWYFWLQMRGEQLIQGTMENYGSIGLKLNILKKEKNYL